MEQLTRGAGGRFVRTRAQWATEFWDDGYADNRGYFRVYRPDYPNAYGDGYAKRAHIVWWLETGHVVQSGENIHHKNENTADDSLGNLELLDHGDHIRHHQTLSGTSLICKMCGNGFKQPKWRVDQRIKEHGHTPRFCSQRCYHKMPRTDKHKENISAGLVLAHSRGKR